MKYLKQTGFLVLFISFLIGCNRHTKPENPSMSSDKTDTTKIVGGGCEGCELMYLGIPEQIQSEHTSIGWTNGKQKLMITGKIFELDGKTPVPNVLIYYWHTDDNGLYSSTNNKNATEHGNLRGWVKSDEKGNYTIRTSRPASYPNETIPQHIHLSIKEPTLKNEYYADLYFDDDPMYVIHKKKYGKQDRAGTEVLYVVLNNAVQVAKHNIILGMNIPYYPAKLD